MTKALTTTQKHTHPGTSRHLFKATGVVSKPLLVAALVLAAVPTVAMSLLWNMSSDFSQANGYAAKTYCSVRYISGRMGADILQHELGRSEVAALNIREHDHLQAVTSSVPLPLATTSFGKAWGLSATAVYRPGLGCTLAVDVGAEELAADLSDSPDPQATPPFELLPTALRTRPKGEVQSYVQGEFSRESGTRALLVWHRNRLIAEHYAADFSAQTPLTSWSMAKSVTHALLGIAVQQGWMSTESRNLLPHWSEDGRRDIRIEDLVRMQSGLEFDETYDIGHDAVEMLYATHSAAAFASSKPLAYPIGTHWQYSSGTTNILARLVGRTAQEQTRLSAAQFARQYLFAPLQTPSFVAEQDAAGNLIGSSYIWGTARDWLQFGRLYLQDGIWDGRRILPQGWAAHAAAPAEHSSGQYGGQFWINGLDPDGERVMPALPADLYYASGFEGQDVVIVPSMDLVVVRLGFTPAESDWNLNTHLAPLLRLLAN